MPFTLPEDCKLVMLAAPVLANAATYDYVCCKDAHKVWFVIQHYGQGGDTNLVVSLKEATAIAGTPTTRAVTATFPIWVDTNAGTASDGLARQATDAASYTIDTTGTNADDLLVIEWDPAKHTAGYDCITMVDTGGDGANIVSALAVIQSRYPSDPPPSAIID